jgi:DNA-binding GntR family transcriptional regulator
LEFEVPGKANASSADLVAKIARESAQKIATGEWADGKHLVAQTLADLFGVSRFPVQAALGLLEELKLVTREPNRGCFVRADQRAVKRALKEISHQPKPDEAYLSIAADRLANRLPEHVKEADLGKAYGLSRVALSAVLHRMAQEGWIERKPGYGWRFLPILTSAEAYRYSFRFRMTIEPAALLEPTFKMSPVVTEKLRAQQLDLLNGRLKLLSSAELFEITSGFHEALVESSGNPFFIDALKKVNRLRRLMEYQAMRPVQIFDEQCREHLALLDMIERGQIKAASEFLKRHIDIGHAKKKDVLNVALTGAVSGSAYLC